MCRRAGYCVYRGFVRPLASSSTFPVKSAESLSVCWKGSTLHPSAGCVFPLAWLFLLARRSRVATQSTAQLSPSLARTRLPGGNGEHVGSLSCLSWGGRTSRDELANGHQRKEHCAPGSLVRGGRIVEPLSRSCATELAQLFARLALSEFEVLSRRRYATQGRWKRAVGDAGSRGQRGERAAPATSAQLVRSVDRRCGENAHRLYVSRDAVAEFQNAAFGVRCGAFQRRSCPELSPRVFGSVFLLLKQREEYMGGSKAIAREV